MNWTEGTFSPGGATSGYTAARAPCIILNLRYADAVKTGYYGELAHYGLHRLAWADVRRA